MNTDNDSIYYHTWADGLRLVHKHTGSPVAYAGIMTGAGTRDEEPEENGMAHYIEHCVFKGCLTNEGSRGTKELSARRIIDRVEGIGGEINAYTTKEETVFYAATPAQYFSRTLRLLWSLVSNPTFPKEETDKECGVILDEIESYNDSPSELIYDDFEGLVFNGHPLAMPILGTRKTLRRISRSAETAAEWMRNHYKRGNTVIFSQGNVPFARVRAAVERITAESGGLVGGGMPSSERLPVPLLTEGREAHFRKHTHQSHAMLGGRAYNIGHKKQLGMYLLNHILGGSMSSRLNMTLREKEGLVYTIESQYTPLSDSGYWNIYLACEPRNREHCVELCMKELRRLREEKLSPAQFRRALVQLHGQMAISAENQENNVLAMGKQMLYHNCAPTWQQTFAHIGKLTAEDLQDIANEVFCEAETCLLTYE